MVRGGGGGRGEVKSGPFDVAAFLLRAGADNDNLASNNFFWLHTMSTQSHRVCLFVEFPEGGRAKLSHGIAAASLTWNQAQPRQDETRSELAMWVLFHSGRTVAPRTPQEWPPVISRLPQLHPPVHRSNSLSMESRIKMSAPIELQLR